MARHSGAAEVNDGRNLSCHDHGFMAQKRTPRRFNAERFLTSAGRPQHIGRYTPNQKIFAQGDRCTSVLFLQRGTVKISMLSTAGKEAVVGMLGAGEFFGEGCLAGQPLRTATATAVAACTVLIVPKREMVRLLRSQRAFADRFISHMLARNIRIEEDLADHLFNFSEKRLARALLLMARYGKHDTDARVLPLLSQEVLAEMVGTTRSRVNFFMNKFRALGLIDYRGRTLTINGSLMNVLLHD
jgi:CRP/FNR family transcriptional regulator, cyclic AMP receptor protein